MRTRWECLLGGIIGDITVQADVATTDVVTTCDGAGTTSDVVTIVAVEGTTEGIVADAGSDQSEGCLKVNPGDWTQFKPHKSLPQTVFHNTTLSVSTINSTWN